MAVQRLKPNDSPDVMDQFSKLGQLRATNPTFGMGSIQALDRLREATGVRYAALYRLDGDTLHRVAESGTLIRAKKGVSEQVLLDQDDALLVQAVSSMATLVDSGRTQSELAAVLALKDKAIGALFVQSSHPDAFDDDALNFYTQLAAQLAPAFESAPRLYDQNINILLDSMVEAYLHVNAGWCFTYVNGPGLELLRRPKEKLIGADFWSTLGGLLPATLRERLTASMASRQPFSSEDQFEQTGNWYQINGTPVPDGMYVSFRPITERKRTEDLLKNRAQELELVAKISATVNQNLNLEHVLQVISDATKDAFNLYHAHVYLLDEAKETLVLAAGAGETGRLMKARGHRIPFAREHSIVARTARTRLGQIVNDVQSEPDYLPNQMLPETRSEMAVPMLVGDEVIGVLDLQSEKLNRFTDEDVRIKTTLADQISVAVQNARLYSNLQHEETRLSQRATELELVSKISAAVNQNLNLEDLLKQVSNETKQAFDLYHAHVWLLDNAKQTLTLAAGAGEVGRLMHERGYRIPLNREHSIVARAARTGQGQVVNDIQSEPDYLPNPLLPNTRSEMSIPMVVNGNVIGVLDVQSEKLNRFTDDDIHVETTLADQIAVAVQNAQLYSNLQQNEARLTQRASELEMVAEIGAAVASNLDPEELLQNFVDMSKSFFKLYHSHVYLLDDNEQMLVLAAGADDAGRQMKARGHAIPISNKQSIVARAARERMPVIENDVRSAPAFLPNPLLPETASEMSIPMIIGDRILGVVDVQSENLNRFTDEDVLIKTIMADQLAVAVQNARLYGREVETSRQLREVDRLKSEFLASMSHELRTPLNSIIGYSEVLADGIDGDLPEEAIIDVQAIHDSGQHLLSLINDILDLAKIEAGHMELDLEEIDLRDVAREVESITQVLLKDKPVQLNFVIAEDVPILQVDHGRMRQILNNLISNAIKFTDEGEIRVSAVLDPTQNDVKVAVKDSGIGIAPEHIALIFEQFRQVDNSSTRKVGGTGLGLPITRRLIQMHGGDITVSSQVGQGSTFSFNIPLTPIPTSN